MVTPCQRERARRSHLPLMPGKHVPRCNVDGTYEEVQCDIAIGQCWCVDRDGREIETPRTEGVIRCGAGTLIFLALVVQTLDSTIHLTNYYPADKYWGNQLRYPVDGDLSSG